MELYIQNVMQLCSAFDPEQCGSESKIKKEWVLVVFLHFKKDNLINNPFLCYAILTHYV